MRCFVAVEIPEKIRAKIFHEFEILQNSGVCFGNFIPKNNIHITLKFLGELTEEEIENVSKKLSEIDFPKFNCQLTDIDFFPHEKHVKVIWLGIDSKELGELEKKISKKLPRYVSDFEKFIPHLTVARIKGVKNKEMFFNKVDSLQKIKDEFKVNSFCLIKSELTSEGPIYRKIKEFKLN